MISRPYIPLNLSDRSFQPALYPLSRTLPSKKLKAKLLKEHTVGLFFCSCLLFHSCTLFVFVIPLVDVHLLICIMNWTVYKWFPPNPSSGSLAVFLISGASDACEMVLLKGVGTNRRQVLLGRAHFNWN